MNAEASRESGNNEGDKQDGRESGKFALHTVSGKERCLEIA